MAEVKGRLTVSVLPPSLMDKDQAAKALDLLHNLPNGGWIGGQTRPNLPVGATPGVNAYANPTSDYFKGSTPSSHSPYADPFNGWLWGNPNQGYRPTPSEAQAARPSAGVSTGAAPVSSMGKEGNRFAQVLAGPRGRR